MWRDFHKTATWRQMKTTIAGLLAAAGAVVQSHVQAGHSLVDWKTWVLPALLAALGFLAGDKKEVTK